VLEGGDRALLADHGLRADLDLALVARIFEPWPIHDQRPSCTRRPADLERHAGPTKHSPSVCRRPRQRSFSHAQRSDQPRVANVSIPWARMKRSSASGRRSAAAGAADLRRA
jgi:hypothetical protein